MAALEARHGEDAVERRVHRDGDDHGVLTLLRDPAPDVVDRFPRIPAGASEEPWLGDASGRDERGRRYQPATPVHADGAEPLPAGDGQRHSPPRDDPHDERPPEADDAR